MAGVYGLAWHDMVGVLMACHARGMAWQVMVG